MVMSLARIHGFMMDCEEPSLQVAAQELALKANEFLKPLHDATNMPDVRVDIAFNPNWKSGNVIATEMTKKEWAVHLKVIPRTGRDFVVTWFLKELYETQPNIYGVKIMTKGRIDNENFIRDAKSLAEFMSHEIGHVNQNPDDYEIL